MKSKRHELTETTQKRLRRGVQKPKTKPLLQKSPQIGSSNQSAPDKTKLRIYAHIIQPQKKAYQPKSGQKMAIRYTRGRNRNWNSKIQTWKSSNNQRDFEEVEKLRDEEQNIRNNSRVKIR